MTNTEIAERFLLLARLLEIQGDNPFKIRSYVKAADVIEEYPRGVITIDDTELYQIKGIGQAIGEKIRELQATGELQTLNKILAAVPAGITELLQVKGLSPKKIGILWKSLEITGIDQLEEACQLNRIAPVKGFGDKTQTALLDAIRFYKRSLSYFRLATVMPFAAEMKAMIQNKFPDNKLEFSGAYRRQMDTVAAIDLVTDLNAADMLPFLSSLDGAVVSESEDNSLMVQLAGKPPLQIHPAAPGQFYEQLFLTSASEAFLTAFREQFILPGDAADEDAIFTANHLSVVPAPLRETACILKLAAAGTLPELITAKDIRGVIHAHSKYSDGAETLEGMALAARDKGYEYLVISDHSQAAFYANGMSPERIIAQHEEIGRLNEQLYPFRIFKAVEADILTDGRLDYDDNVLNSFDLVIASVHSNLNMTEEKATKRLLAAIANPYTRILGHPTGRQLLIREGYPIDHKAVIDACIAHNVVIEINANPRRLDLDWRWVAYALEQGAILSVNPDAHTVKGIDDIRYGVMAGQKGGLTADRNLSSYPLEKFEAFLRRQS